MFIVVSPATPKKLVMACDFARMDTQRIHIHVYNGYAAVAQQAFRRAHQLNFLFKIILLVIHIILLLIITTYTCCSY